MCNGLAYWGRCVSYRNLANLADVIDAPRAIYNSRHHFKDLRPSAWEHAEFIQ